MTTGECVGGTMSSDTVPVLSPRDNLFLYVNQAWLASADIPADRSQWSVFDEMKDRVESECHQLVMSLSSDADKNSDRTKVWGLYRSFMDEQMIDTRGFEAIVPILAEIDSIDCQEDLMRFCGWSMRHGVRSLFRFDEDVDPNEPSRYVAYITQSGLGLPDASFYLTDRYQDLRRHYQDLIEYMVSVTGLQAYGDEMRNVVELEGKIAALHWSRTRRRDLRAMNHAESWDDLVADTRLPWECLLDGAHLSNSTVSRIISAQSTYPREVAELVRSTPLDKWRSWARWMVLVSLSPYLSSPIASAYFDFFGRKVLGLAKEPIRWRQGLKFAEGIAGDVIGQLYVERFCPYSTRTRATEFVRTISNGYRDAICRSNMFEATTKEAALQKLDNLTVLVGSPSKCRDYSTLKVDSTDLVGNAMRGAAFAWDYAFALVGRPVDREEWTMFPQTVNAAYHPLRNRIILPAAMLQPPLFGSKMAVAGEYGALGALVAHEMGHAFDDKGATTDWSGRLANWWSATDRSRFKRLTESLMAEYNALALVPGEPACGARVDGTLTLGENLADIGGLAVAHAAWLRARGTASGVGIAAAAGEEAFFGGWASMWRSKTRPEAAIHLGSLDRHAPAEVRCNQSAKHLEAFHAAFHTQPGDGMWLAPEDRVSMW